MATRSFFKVDGGQNVIATRTVYSDPEGAAALAEGMLESTAWVGRQPTIGDVFNGVAGIVVPVTAINPLITPAQAKATLKTLLETNPNAYTQLQRDQLSYLLLLALFRDLQKGNVY